MLIHPAIKSNIFLTVRSKGAVGTSSVWNWVGRTDIPASDLQEPAVLPEQDTARALLPSCCLLLHPGEAKAQKDQSRTPGMCWHSCKSWLCPAAVSGSPWSAATGQDESWSFNSAGCGWLRSPVPPGSYSGDFPCLHSKKGRKCIISSVIQVPCSKGHLKGQTFRLLLLSDRGGSCQLSIELSSRQRCPPGSWLSCLGSPLKGHVQLDVQEMELIGKCLNILF